MSRTKDLTENRRNETKADDRFIEQQMEITGVLLIGLSLLCLLAIFFEGVGIVGGIGEILRQSLHFTFGERGAVFPIIIMAVIGWVLLTRRSSRYLIRNLVAIGMLFLWVIIVLHMFSGIPLTGNHWAEAYRGGGLIGHFLAINIRAWFGQFGSAVFMLIWLAIAAILALDRPLLQVITSMRSDRTRPFETAAPATGPALSTPITQLQDDTNLGKPEAVNTIPVIHSVTPERSQSSILSTLQGMLREKENSGAKREKPTREKTKELPADKVPKSESVNVNPKSNVVPLRPPGRKGDYELPDPDLIGTPSANFRKNSQNNQHSHQLEETLANFGVHAKVIDVHYGPVITRYDIQPAPGVKVSRIVNLADDLALALAAKGLRLEAPIPGKAAIGIEVPNQEAQIVSFRDTLESKAFWNTGKLSVALGLDIGGDVAVVDLRKMPHLLVAGSTGSGKSVCINTLIMSVLFKAFPNEVKFIMIDPKMVELSMYNGIPHLMAPVVTEAKKAAGVLRLVVNEMERRYKIFAEARVREIDTYNESLPEAERLPYIMVIIDELADLMMIAPAEVEDSICRLAQMARAVGIHLVIATQRPSVDVITGLIKANVPSRIAFAVKSQIDSRTILDSVGAERLLGRGDMLFAPVGAMKPNRIQGALVVEKEIEVVIKHWKEQGEPSYQEQYVNVPDAQEAQVKEEEDDLFWEAVQVVIDHGQASASVLQRKLRVGYTRAARLVDMMEAKGMIGPYEGSKPREVIINGRQLEELRKRTQ